MKTAPFLVVFFLLFGFTTFGQIDFNHYRTLESKGPMPDDFYTSTLQKIRDRQNAPGPQTSAVNDYQFLHNIYYQIDNILHSGFVTYGDDVSQYVSEIADKILLSEPELRKKLRFYTLKSNVANAFSTDQGIVFITTGLISQLVNEAQLAFILSHEITHFQYRHVVQRYNRTSDEAMTKESISNLSQYSKSKEYEADVLGLKYYYEAGYSKADLLPTFDVLLYAYLPIDNLPFRKDYFNSEQSYLPEKLFEKEEKPITASEKVDDTYSTHPNIKNRKDSVWKEISKYNNWGNASFLLGKERFHAIRKICRYERVRTSLIIGDYIDALYTIYILEENGDKSFYLDKMKARVWQAAVSGSKEKDFKPFYYNSIQEGLGTRMGNFLNSLFTFEASILSMRISEDLLNQYPDEKEARIIWEATAQNFYDIHQESFDSFSKIPYLQALQLQKTKKEPTEVLEEKEKTKYDRIKETKNLLDENMDTTDYFYFMLSDLITSDRWNSTIQTIQSNEKAELERDVQAFQLSRRKLAIYKNQQNVQTATTDISTLLLYEPVLFRKLRKKGIDLPKTNNLSQRLIHSLDASCEAYDIQAKTISRHLYTDSSTLDFNHKAALACMRYQSIQMNGNSFLPVDWEILNELKEIYQTDKVAFISGTTKNKMNFIHLLVGVVSPAIYASVAFIPTFMIHESTITMVILNLSTGKIECTRESASVDRPNKRLLKARFYQLFDSIQSKK